VVSDGSISRPARGESDIAQVAGRIIHLTGHIGVDNISSKTPKSFATRTYGRYYILDVYGARVVPHKQPEVGDERTPRSVGMLVQER
jgi:hypothetical protein